MRGFCGIGIYQPKAEMNIGTLWRSAHAYGANFIFTVGARYKRQATDTTKASRHVPLVHYTDIEDLVDHLPYGCLLVGVELSERAKLLPDTTHTPQAAYLLGAEDIGLPESVMNRCHRIIQIPSPTPLCLNVATAGSIVLYDRYIRSERSFDD